MSTEVALTNQHSTIPSEAEIKGIEFVVRMAMASKLLPRAIDTEAKAITIALKAREIGVPPMQGFAHIYIVDGKPTISSELMMALIQRNVPNAQVVFDVGDTQCTIVAKRSNGSGGRFSFTIEDAKKAGLLGKDNWKKYPRAMLRSRCIAEMARTVFPDALMGCSYTTEELNPNARVDEEGKVIEIPSAPTGAENSAEILQAQIKAGIERLPEQAKGPATESLAAAGDDVARLEKIMNRIRTIVNT